MSRASQFEQENDAQFHALANKVSVFKNIANDINNYAQQDNDRLNTLSDQMSVLQENIRSTASKLTHVMRSNPKVTKMAGVAFLVFLLIYYSVRHFY